MKKHRDSLTAVMQLLQLGQGFPEFPPNVVDRSDIQRGADFTARPDRLAGRMRLAAVEKSAGRIKNVRQQYAKLPAVTLGHRPVEVGAIRPLPKEFFDNPGRSPNELVVAAADRQCLEAAFDAKH